MPLPGFQPFLPTVHTEWTDALSLAPGPRMYALRKLLRSLLDAFEYIHPTERPLPPSEVSRLYLDYGLTRAFLGEYHLASLALEKAVVYDECFALAWFAYGLACAEMGRRREAGNKFERCFQTINRNGKGLGMVWYKIFQGPENALLGLGEGWALEQTKVFFNYEIDRKGQARQTRNGLNGIPAGVYLGPGWDVNHLRLFVSPTPPGTARHSKSLPVLPSTREVPIRSWFPGDDSSESNRFKALRSASVDQDYGEHAQVSNALRLSSDYKGDTFQSSIVEDDEDVSDFTIGEPRWNEGDDSPDTVIQDASRLSWTQRKGSPKLAIHNTPLQPWDDLANSLNTATRNIIRPSIALADNEDSPYVVTNAIPDPLRPQKDTTPTTPKPTVNKHLSVNTHHLIPIISQDFATPNAPRLSLLVAPDSPYPVQSALPSPLRLQSTRTPTSWQDIEDADLTPIPRARAVRTSVTPSKTSKKDDSLIPLMAPRKGVETAMNGHFRDLPRYSRAEHYGDFADFDAGTALWKLQRSDVEGQASLRKGVRDSWIDDDEEKAEKRLERVQTRYFVRDLEKMDFIDNVTDGNETAENEGNLEIPELRPAIYEGFPHGFRKGTV